MPQENWMSENPFQFSKSKNLLFFQKMPKSRVKHVRKKPKQEINKFLRFLCDLEGKWGLFRLGDIHKGLRCS